MPVYQCHKGKGTSCRDLLASKVSMVDGIKDVSERIQFGSLILKNSGPGDMAESVFWSATSSTTSSSSTAKKFNCTRSYCSLALLGMSIEVARAVEVWTFV